MVVTVKKNEICNSKKKSREGIIKSAPRISVITFAAQRQAVYAEVLIHLQGIPHNTEHLMHDMRDSWRNQGYGALHYQQELYENAAHEHQRVAYEEVKELQLLFLRVVQQRK